jgi:hypothetical protein
MTRVRRGFSLVLSLTIMSLLVLVILSLAGFLSIESRVAAVRLELAKARLNALASGRLALGHLQLLAGPDQRVTARADIFEGAAAGAQNPGGTGPTGNSYASLAAGASGINGSSVNPRKRNWTGVWATGGADTSKPRDWDPRSPDRRILLGWLVSPLGASTTQPDLPDPSLQPFAPPNRNFANGTDAQNRGLPFINGTTPASLIQGFPASANLVNLVGLGTLDYPGRPSYAAGAAATTNVDPDLIALPAVPLPGPLPADAGNATRLIGRFAWWVGDEGTKVRATLVNPLARTREGREFAGLTDWERRFRAQSHAHGIELIGPGGPAAGSTRALADFEAWRAADLAEATGGTESLLAKVASSAGLRGWAALRGGSSAATAEASARLTGQFYHEVTPFSAGVLSDTLNGGLRRDLSIAFELPFADYRALAEFHDSPGESGDINGAGGGWTQGFNLAATMGINAANTPGFAEWGAPGRRLGFVYEIPVPASVAATRAANTGNPGANGVPSVVRGPTWDLYRNYHRLYKRELEARPPRAMANPGAGAWVARGSEPPTYAIGGGSLYRTTPDGQPGYISQRANAALMTRKNAAGAYQSANPIQLTNLSSHAHYAPGVGPIPVHTSMKLAPNVVRFAMAFSPVWETSPATKLGVAIDPRVTLHNPYNVPIEFTGMGMTLTKFYKLMFAFQRSDTGESLGTIVMQPTYVWGRGLTFRILDNEGVLANPLGGNLRLEPGELRTYCASPTTNQQVGEVNYANATGLREVRNIPGVFNYGNAGQALVYRMATPPDPSGWASGSIRIRAGFGYNPTTGAEDGLLYETGQVDFHLLHRAFENGTTYNPATRAWIGFADGTADTNLPEIDAADEPLVHRIQFYPRGLPADQRVVTSPDITPNAPIQVPFAMMDLRARAWLESGLANQRADTASALFLNHRAQLLDYRNHDGDANAPAGWALEFGAANALLTNYEMSGERNNSFWGPAWNSAGGGQTRVILHQVPTRPLVSLAGFASADHTHIDTQSGLTVGNSHALPGLDDTDRILTWPSGNGVVSTNEGGARMIRHDATWAANHALWDRYFLSGAHANEPSSHGEVPKPDPAVPDTLRSVFDELQAGRRPLANRSLAWLNRGESAYADFRDPARVARLLMTEGAFNVNSVSKEAWRAVLAGLRHQQLPGATKAATDRTPLSRLDTVGGDHDSPNPAARHRALTDAEVDRLAEAVVREVRRRGPFMSLADFVNRRLVPLGDETGHKGALQAAIDAAGLNDAGPLNATFAADGTRHPSGRALAASGNAARAQAALGATGHLLQSDILNAIGHALSARSDTFVVRAYGEAVGPDGRATTGAWIELTVQRLPDPVAGGTLEPNERAADYRSLHDLASTQAIDERFRARAWSSLSAQDRTNRTFGRKFRVVGARWLAPNEI